MPCEVRVSHVVPGQPEFRGAPVLKTVLRKPGLQVLLPEGVPLDEGLGGEAAPDPLVWGGCMEDVLVDIAAGQTAAMLLATRDIKKNREDIIINSNHKSE